MRHTGGRALIHIVLHNNGVYDFWQAEQTTAEYLSDALVANKGHLVLHGKLETQTFSAVGGGSSSSEIARVAVKRARLDKTPIEVHTLDYGVWLVTINVMTLPIIGESSSRGIKIKIHDANQINFDSLPLEDAAQFSQRTGNMNVSVNCHGEPGILFAAEKEPDVILSTIFYEKLDNRFSNFSGSPINIHLFAEHCEAFALAPVNSRIYHVGKGTSDLTLGPLAMTHAKVMGDFGTHFAGPYTPPLSIIDPMEIILLGGCRNRNNLLFIDPAHYTIHERHGVFDLIPTFTAQTESSRLGGPILPTIRLPIGCKKVSTRYKSQSLVSKPAIGFDYSHNSRYKDKITSHPSIKIGLNIVTVRFPKFTGPHASSLK